MVEGSFGRPVGALLHGAAGGVRVVRVHVEIGAGAVILEEARKALRARPQAVIEADRGGRAGDDADARVAALHPGVKGLEHAKVRARREVVVARRALGGRSMPRGWARSSTSMSPSWSPKWAARNSPSRPKLSSASSANRVRRPRDCRRRICLQPTAGR